MGLLDDMLRGFLGGGGQGGGSLLQAAIEMIQSQPGGLAGLLEKLRASGLDDVVGSWIGMGKNAGISADQLGQVLGGDFLGQLAQKTGLPANEAASGLADMLPRIVDMLTPQGALPGQETLQAGLLDVLRKVSGR